MDRLGSTLAPRYRYHRKRLIIHSIQALSVLAAVIAMVTTGHSSFVAAGFAALTALFGLLTAIRASGEDADEVTKRGELFTTARDAARQVKELFTMTDMLQAAESLDDAAAILTRTAQRVLPDYGGALYVYRNSRDRLERLSAWGTCPGFAPGASLQPQECWALKRGKTHINSHQAHDLRCRHARDTAAQIEIPMMARGRIHGLLLLAHPEENAQARLESVSLTARALADSVSLAISNITLRERLRTQSLRDPLTGLYNRRYLEDALERFVHLASRSGSPTSVIMIDLDAFKGINDAHGHAKGDAILRDASARMVDTVQPSDVVARFGGEEFVIILPECPLEDATRRAEELRQRIETLSDQHGVRISASLGVASLPATCSTRGELIPMADKALYEAKNAGRNRVVTAPLREGRSDARVTPLSSRLASQA